MKISRFLVNIIKMCNMFGMNENINHFSSILVHNMDDLLCFFFVFICLDVFWFLFATFQFTSIDFKRKWILVRMHGFKFWHLHNTIHQTFEPTIFHFAPKFKVILLIKQNMYIEKEKMKNMLMTKAYHP